MENNRSSKIIAIVALCVGVVGLSLGFAAFSNTLTISSSATVTPDEGTFNVAFVADTLAAGEGEVCTVTGDATVSGTVAANSISDLAVGFTAPGQKVTCTATVANTGEYEAFLNAITTDGDMITCQAITPTTEETNAGKTIATDALVQLACEDIKYTVTAGSASDIATKAEAMDVNPTAVTIAPKDGTQTVTIEVEYLADGDRADGKFQVNLPDVKLTYDSLEK